MVENFCIHEEILQTRSYSSQKRVGYDDKMIAGEILSFNQVAEFSMNKSNPTSGFDAAAHHDNVSNIRVT